MIGQKQSTDHCCKTTEKVGTWVLFCICCFSQVISHSWSLQRRKYRVCDLWFCCCLFTAEFCAGHLNYLVIFCLNSTCQEFTAVRVTPISSQIIVHTVLRAAVTQQLGLWASDSKVESWYYQAVGSLSKTHKSHLFS